MTNWVPDAAPVSDADIAEIEHELGVKFPEALLALVRVGDGMQPENRIVKHGGRVIEGFSQILPFAHKAILTSCEGLLENAEDVGRDPKDLRWVIPIIDTGDGWICLDYRDDPQRLRYRVVGYSLSPVDEADANGLYPIADSFEELVGMLRP